MKMSKKSLTIDQGQRMVRSLPCCILSVCHFFDHLSNGKYTRDLCRVFRVRELPVYLREALLSRINPIQFSLTYTVASSFVCTSPLAVKTVVGFFRDFCGFQFGRVLVFPAQLVHACAGINNKFFSSDFIVDGAGKRHSLVGEKKVVFSVSLS